MGRRRTSAEHRRAHGAKHYVRKYAHAVLAPLQLQMPDPATGELVMLDAEHVTTLVDGVLDQLVFRVFRPGSINLQKYTADQGGYPYWHCELYPKADNGERCIASCCGRSI